MSQEWTGVSERGHPLAYEIILRLGLLLGRPLSRLLLIPITAYFFLTAPRVRQASRQFMERALDRAPKTRDLWRHLFCFATTLLDRIYLLTGQHGKLDITIHGRRELDSRIQSNRGCMLLGSHLGSFEVLRALGMARTDLDIRVVMETHQTPGVDSILQRLNPAAAGTVIPLQAPDALLRVQESLQNGAVVGFLGDRLVNTKRSASASFLGQTTRFPTGPLHIARRLGVPVVLFFGIHLGGKHYEIHLEPFLDPENGGEQDKSRLEDDVARYARRLEAYARAYPYNWFNFYDFWNA